MTNKELIGILNLLPADAVIYRVSDHGQNPELDPYISVCTEELLKFPYYGEDLDWEDIEDAVPSEVTAILIG